MLLSNNIATVLFTRHTVVGKVSINYVLLCAMYLLLRLLQAFVAAWRHVTLSEFLGVPTPAFVLFFVLLLKVYTRIRP